MKRLRRFTIGVFLVCLTAFLLYFTWNIAKKDNTVPEISFDSKVLQVSIEAQEKDFLQGVTAFDKKDGDITDDIIIESSSRFVEQGKFIVKYTVFDSDGHIAKAERDVEFTDYTPPVINSDEVIIVSKTINPVDILQYVSAIDCIDGDITSKIRVNYNDYYFNCNELGTYKVQLQISNSYGDMATKDIKVRVTDGLH